MMPAIELLQYLLAAIALLGVTVVAGAVRWQQGRIRALQAQQAEVNAGLRDLERLAVRRGEKPPDPDDGEESVIELDQ